MIITEVYLSNEVGGIARRRGNHSRKLDSLIHNDQCFQITDLHLTGCPIFHISKGCVDNGSDVTANIPQRAGVANVIELGTVAYDLQEDMAPKL